MRNEADMCPQIMVTDRHSDQLQWRRIVLGMAAFLGTCANINAAESAPVDSKVLNERYKQIVDMPQNVRDRLERNIAKFAAMSATERDKYRTLNRQLEENRSLTILLQTYSAWLQTLTPSQREELRLATDSAQKMALVRKFKEDQYHSIDLSIEVNSDLGLPGGRGFAFKPISSAEIHAMMKVVLAELPADDRERYAKASRSAQYVEILQRSIQASTDGPRAWPTVELQEKLLGALQRTDVRNFIRSQPMDQREILIRMMFSAVGSLALREGSNFPKDPDLDKVYSQVDADEKARLDQLPRERKRFQLARRYFDQRGDNTFKHFDDIRTKLGHLMQQLNLPPPRGSMRGDGRGFGPRGGPEDRPHPTDRPPLADPPPGRDGRPPRRSPPP